MASDQDRQSVIAAGQRRLKQPPGRRPLVLPHDQIRRILDRKPTLLILTRDLDPGVYVVHDDQTVKRNLRHQRDRRSDLQSDPAVFMVEVEPPARTMITDLELVTVNHAGFKTLEEFFWNWPPRRWRFHTSLELTVYPFQIPATARFLHQKVHRGYTHDPAEAVPDEPEALDDDVLQDLTVKARERYRTEHAADVARRESQSLARQLREATTRATLRGKDITPEISAIQHQLQQIRSKLGEAA